MESYVNTIEQGVYIFPIAVALFSIPYFYYQYKKYGSIDFNKSILSFTFLLYIIICYCLIILPLPDYEDVLNSTGPYVDFRIFGFMEDFINKVVLVNGISSIGTIIRSPWFYIPFFNLIMLIPFGIYQKRLFKNTLPKTTLYAFLLSLSFELIQLSGLFGIYPHPYRLFQFDDILLNTLGAIIGWLIAPKSYIQFHTTVNITFKPNFKIRFLTFFLDLIILSIGIRILYFIIGTPSISGNIFSDYWVIFICGILYFGILSWFLDQKTPASFIYDLTYRDYLGTKVHFLPFFLRQLILTGVLIPMPLLAINLIFSKYSKVLTIPFGVIGILIPVIVLAQLFTDNAPFYEQFSKVYLADNKKLSNVRRPNRLI